jgi:hypothetical protein
MRPAGAADAPLAPGADRATIVFFRPSRFGAFVNFLIYDAKGEFLGDAVANSYFAVRLPPGGYTILAEGENTAALYAHVAAGKTYYVEVVPHLGWGRARVSLEALRPGHPDLPGVASWLRGSSRLEPVADLGRRRLGAGAAGRAARVADAKRAWDAFDAAERRAHSLEPGDGF